MTEKHYAKIVDGKVETIIVADEDFISKQNGTWVLCTGNKKARKDGTFANNKFTMPKPFKSWILKDDDWIPPKVKPTADGQLHFWSEKDLTWKVHGERTV